MDVDTIAKLTVAVCKLNENKYLPNKYKINKLRDIFPNGWGKGTNDSEFLRMLSRPEDTYDNFHYASPSKVTEFIGLISELC